MTAALVIGLSAITVIGLVGIVVLVGRVAEEALRVRREVAFFSDLRPALMELRTEVQSTAETWGRVGRR